MLSVAGVKPPAMMEGRAFMGEHQVAAQKYLFGYRDRMDERPDFSQAVRDEKFLYIRNYMPFLPAGQFVEYQNETPTTAVWRKMFLDGKLDPIESQFWETRASEELYDLEVDPEETKNLATDAEYKDVLNRFRKAHREQVVSSRDLGFMNEGELAELVKTGSPRDLIGKDNFPMERIFEMATLASNGNADLQTFLVGLDDQNTTIRYWSAMGLRIQAEKAARNHGDFLVQLMQDSAPAVSILAAETLAMHGDHSQVTMALAVLKRQANFETTNYYHAIHAMNVLDRLDEKTKPIFELLMDLPVKTSIERSGDYLERLKRSIVAKQAGDDRQ